MIVLAYFSFGQFYFFNFFGLSLVVKTIISVSTILGFTFILFNDELFKKPNKFIFCLLFFSVYGFSLILSPSFTYLYSIEIIIMFTISVFILYVNEYHLDKIINYIIKISLLFALGAIFVSLIYSFIPTLYNQNSVYLVSSETSNNYVATLSILDYLGLPSQGGLNLFGFTLQKVKSFSSEPSAALSLFYPALILILLKYSVLKESNYKVLALSVFILFFIFSLLGILIFLLSFVITILFKLKDKIVIFIITIIATIFFTTLISEMDNVVQLITGTGAEYNFTLMSEKRNSTLTRLTSFWDAISTIKNMPFGGSGQTSMTSLFLQVGLSGGVIAMLLYLIFILSLYFKSISVFKASNSIKFKFGLTLMISVLLVTFSLTAYGWATIQGVIAFSLFYRVISDLDIYSAPEKI